jgi:carboxypeptidase C (cathepsin A)
MWLESPAGVGFSLAAEDDLHQNDMTTSEDALVALQQWYLKFPEFAKS